MSFPFFSRLISILDKHVLRQSRSSEIENTLRRSDLFDADWYLAVNADVAAEGMDPVTH